MMKQSKLTWNKHRVSCTLINLISEKYPIKKNSIVLKRNLEFLKLYELMVNAQIAYNFTLVAVHYIYIESRFAFGGNGEITQARY